MLGAPPADRDRFRGWSDELALVAFGAGGDARADRHERALRGLEEMAAYFRELVARAPGAPAGDMLSAMIAGDTPSGGVEEHGLTDDELVGMCALLLFAGHETTTNSIANAVRLLTADPVLRDRVRDDPALVGPAVEESLRLAGPIKVLVRWVVADHELRGRRIRAGERVYLLLCGANRDPERFTDPDAVDLARERATHVAFGRGIHACIGAQLARLETRIAVGTLLRRLPGLRVDGDPAVAADAGVAGAGVAAGGARGRRRRECAVTPRERVTTLFELVDESAAIDPDAEALVFADGERLTVGALAERSVRHAAALLALGVAAGDRVALLLPASADLVALLLAVTRVGAVAVPVNARYRPAEVRHVVVHSGAALVVCAPAPTPGAPDLADLARSAVAEGPTPELRALVTLDELGEHAARPRRPTPRPAPASATPRCSSTPRAPPPPPKGALLSHEALVRLAAGIAARMALTPTDRIWTAIPLFHGGGITFALAALTARAAFVHPGHFDPTTTPGAARGRADHGRARGVRDDLAAGARPPRLGPRATVPHPARHGRRRPRAAARRWPRASRRRSTSRAWR